MEAFELCVACVGCGAASSGKAIPRVGKRQKKKKKDGGGGRRENQIIEQKGLESEPVRCELQGLQFALLYCHQRPSHTDAHTQRERLLQVLVASALKLFCGQKKKKEQHKLYCTSRQCLVVLWTPFRFFFFICIFAFFFSQISFSLRLFYMRGTCRQYPAEVSLAVPQEKTNKQTKKQRARCAVPLVQQERG
jgi:hypothetical protein